MTGSTAPREAAVARNVRECIETAARFLAAQDGAAQRVLALHRRRPNGRCSGCRHTPARWPCSIAGIALRALEPPDECADPQAPG